MKYTLKLLFLFMFISNLAFIIGCSNDREGIKENQSKEYSRNSYNKDVIGFKSDFPQSDWDLKRQTGRLVGAEPILFITCLIFVIFFLEIFNSFLGKDGFIIDGN